MSTRWPVRIWSLAEHAVDHGHIATVDPQWAAGAPDRLTLLITAAGHHRDEEIRATWELTDRTTPGDGQGGWHLIAVTQRGPRGTTTTSIRVRDIAPIVGAWRTQP